jgi:hypothetical protein
VRQSQEYLTILPHFTIIRSQHNPYLTILPLVDCDIHLWRQLMVNSNKVITPQIQGLLDVIIHLVSTVDDKESPLF